MTMDETPTIEQTEHIELYCIVWKNETVLKPYKVTHTKL